MKKSLLVVGGLVLLAGVLVYGLLTSVVKPVTIVVAARDLPAGTRLTDAVLTTKSVPGGAVDDGTFTDVQEAVGKVLTTARVAGDPITAYVAGENATAAGIPAQLEPGTVAVAVKVDNATGLAGIVRPGQKVAVIAIVDPGKVNANDQVQSVLSADLQGQDFFGNENAPAPASGPTPTPKPTATPQPPLSPSAGIAVTGLRVLVVPQSFRYEEVPTDDQQEMFAAARTSTASQSGSVILLEVPVKPVKTTGGMMVSPAELLALLNNVATIHLALEPSDGLGVSPVSIQPVDLTTLYEGMTGYKFIP